MIGAIAGDIIGSVYEHRPVKTTGFELFDPRATFTDDTVLTVAVADAILNDLPYAYALQQTGRRHPRAGYGASFIGWLHSETPRPYGSWGNGAAMRVSPIGFACDSEDAVLTEARRSAEVSHDHPEGIKGAQATALAVYLARTGASRSTIRDRIEAMFGYDLHRRIAGIRPHYVFDVSCQGSVPEAIIAFLESNSYEDAVRNAISLGGDADTLACICGGIAEAYYDGVPAEFVALVETTLTADLLEVVRAFRTRFGIA